MKFKPLFFFALTFGLLTQLAFSQSAVLLPSPIQQFTFNGDPVAGGTVAFYQSGTFTAQAIYADAGAVNLLPNPITLNSGGLPQNASGAPTPIYLTPGTAYRVVLKNSSGVQLWLADNVTGLASSAAVQSSVVPFASTLVFTACADNQLFFVTLTGNVTSSSFNECPGVQLPAFVTFELIQDGTGSRTFSWPSNSVGGGLLAPAANAITVQTYLWDGSTLQAIAPAMGNDGILRFGSISTSAIALVGTSPLILGNNVLVWAGSGLVSVHSGTFGTSPSIVNSNGEATFEINVGTGGTATTGQIDFLKAAANGWSCQVTDMNSNIVTRETAFTVSSVTFTAASAWTASDNLLVNCLAF